MSQPLRGKVLCGYQGWFRCPGDGTPDGWRHWFRGNRSSPETLTVEMWPDLSQYDKDERFPAPGFTYPDGSPAVLFSSAHPKTVRRHFDWMRRYGIDGVSLQRFLVELRNTAYRETVLGHVQAAARESQRSWCVEYDLSGARESEILGLLTSDWRWLTQTRKITREPGYLWEGGKPVVGIWGFFPDRFSAATAHAILDAFKDAYVIGGVPWPWRQFKDPEWARALRRFGALSPWNVGNWDPRTGRAATHYWRDDKAEAERNGMLWLPVLYPGFRWDNLQRLPAGKSEIPRRKGAFLSEQFTEVSGLSVSAIKVAMFDEVDEGTALLPVTNTPPREARFLTLDGLPSDHYLKLVGAATAAFHAKGKHR